MKFEQKIHKLKDQIERQLLPLIDHDYVLWDLPYHSNIGDILIWEGELYFLKSCHRKCLGYSALNTFHFPHLPDDIIILLHGGGNFGDVWRKHQEFRLEVIRRYPHHRIIVFPQTVYYQDVALMQEDARLMAEHPDLILCARDQVSYDLLKKHFRNQILLVPDMAFCISPDNLSKYKQGEKERILFLKRTDKELSSIAVSIPENGLPVDVRDWPSMEKRMWKMFLFEKSLGLTLRFQKWGWNDLYRCGSGVIDWYAERFLRPVLVRKGVEFVSSYRYIYTTRLHVMILSVLLGKECTFLDNSYGKNSAFYDTWLKDLPGVQKAESVVS